VVGTCLAHEWAGYEHKGHRRGLPEPAGYPLGAGLCMCSRGLQPHGAAPPPTPVNTSYDARGDAAIGAPSAKGLTHHRAGWAARGSELRRHASVWTPIITCIWHNHVRLEASRVILEASHVILEANHVILEASRVILEASHVRLEANHVRLEASHDLYIAYTRRLESQLPVHAMDDHPRLRLCDAVVRERWRETRPTPARKRALDIHANAPYST